MALRFSSQVLLTLGLSILATAPGSNAWLLEFWSGKEDCNYQINDNGNTVAADTKHGGDDHQSNNCMMMSSDPFSDGLKAMRVTEWTEDCVIALWSDATGSSPCQGKIPYGGSMSQKPDQVFAINSSDVAWASDESFACISPLNDYVQSNSGVLGYVAYSCGGNATLLVEEFEKNYDDDQMRSLVRSLTASTTTTAVINSTGSIPPFTNATSTPTTAAQTTATGQLSGGDDDDDGDDEDYDEPVSTEARRFVSVSQTTLKTAIATRTRH